MKVKVYAAEHLCACVVTLPCAYVIRGCSTALGTVWREKILAASAGTFLSILGGSCIALSL